MNLPGGVQRGSYCPPVNESSPPLHPLLGVLREAASGRFPPADGDVVFVPPLRPGLEAVVSLTGRAYLATELSALDFGGLRLDGLGAALAPAVLLRLAGAAGKVGVIDASLAARGTGHSGDALPLRADLDGHPRVQHARSLREEVRVYGDARGLVTVARGLAGRTELSVEAADGQEPGAGRSLIADALGLVATGEPVFAAVSPGNARSLRAFLAAGFVPVGSEVLIRVQRSGRAGAPLLGSSRSR